MAGRSLLLTAAILLLQGFAGCKAWLSTGGINRHESTRLAATASDNVGENFPSRRGVLQSFVVTGIAACQLVPPSYAAETTASAEITDRAVITVKGLGPETKQIVIGLFGKDAPNSVAQFKQLLTGRGLPAPCRPRAERTLQKEQLEANKVYNSCKESEEVGVNLKYSSIWRIVKDERIDMGAVSGRFIAREYPTWSESTSPSLRHDAPGIVSVRRGNDSGFGFTLYPGDGKSKVQDLDESNIVIGRVIEGMDVVKELNEVPVINSAKVNYMGLTGGPKTSNAPDRSCRYGGPMYCNENKPLVKLGISDTEILK